MSIFSREKGLIFSVVVIICSLLFLSCASTKTTTRKNKKPNTVKIIPKTNIVLPEGWIDITDRSKISSVILWIANQDFSASMALKEFQADELTKQKLFNEDICFIANISLRLKVADESLLKRVTKIPELLSGYKGSCTYVYEKKGFLRRVIVFRNQNKVYELELMQENSSKPFDELTLDQINVMKLFLVN